MTASSVDLKNIFAAGRPLVERAINLSEEMAALREAATAKGIDWSQVKALLKAQILDERDDAGGHKRLNRVLEKAEFATAYADMLGLTPDMNEKNFSAAIEAVPHDSLTGEIIEVRAVASEPLAPQDGESVSPHHRHDGPTAVPEAGGAEVASATVTVPPDDYPDMPAALDRRVRAA